MVNCIGKQKEYCHHDRRQHCISMPLNLLVADEKICGGQ
jgi:hypothetical protein